MAKLQFLNYNRFKNIFGGNFQDKDHHECLNTFPLINLLLNNFIIFLYIHLIFKVNIDAFSHGVIL